MCSIFGSTKLEDIRKLLELNKSRGGYSWSFGGFNYSKEQGISLVTLYKGLGAFPLNMLKDYPEPDYYLGHIQIPTGGGHGWKRVHPAIVNDKSLLHDVRYLWHNGLMHSDWMNSSKERKGKWDTEVLLSSIHEHGLVTGLSKVQGSYGCVLYNRSKSLCAFRNKHAQLHYGENLQISSVAFPGSKLFDDNTIFEIKVGDMKFEKILELSSIPEDVPLYYFNL